MDTTVTTIWRSLAEIEPMLSRISDPYANHLIKYKQYNCHRKIIKLNVIQNVNLFCVAFFKRCTRVPVKILNSVCMQECEVYYEAAFCGHNKT